MAEIILHGDCLVNRAAELHQLFLHHLNSSDEMLVVDMSATGRCDLSFFQLICAACRSFASQNKRTTLRKDLSPVILKQFHKAGLESACATCSCDQCLLKAAVDHQPKEHGP
ncbi:MAG: STAS domain-containing protein [Desulfosudaceae bacterium]